MEGVFGPKGESGVVAGCNGRIYPAATSLERNLRQSAAPGHAPAGAYNSDTIAGQRLGLETRMAAQPAALSRPTRVCRHTAHTALPALAMPPAYATYGLVPMLHVRDLDVSSRFYTHLGFERVGEHSQSGRLVWCHLRAPSSELFLSLASGVVPAEQQAVLLYLYSRAVIALRAALLSHGLPEAGPLVDGQLPKQDGGHWPLGRVFPIRTPFYMPDGELRLEDPDGYVILVGQLERC
jgi:catechol 2,3-dioxygenase-like lactoylglutathione lyase family enzyme